MHLENLVLRFHMPYITLTSFIILVNVYLFNLYRFAKNGSHTSRRPWSPRQLGFSPADLGGFSHWQLTLTRDKKENDANRTPNSRPGTFWTRP
jgi:hypothetical protein